MKVSRICLGCMGFGDATRWIHKWVLNEADSRPIIKKALELEPDNGAYLDSLGWVLYKLGRPEDALPHLRKAAEQIKDDDAVVYEHLADVLLKLGKKAEAVDYLRKAVKHDPNNKDLAEKLQKLSGEKSATQ